MSPLIGHEAAWAEWRAALAGSRLHHAWILAGPKGLGKGAFARTAARELVGAATMPPTQLHPDIITPEHPPENKEEAAKRDAGEAYRRKRSIPIGEVRALQRRLTTRPTLGPRRAVIIDPADDLEKEAINALLKTLEEPPEGTFFLLVSHRPGRLLPTVRSRCRLLRFAPLSPTHLAQVLAAARPDLDPPTRAMVIAGAGGAPGIALELADALLGGVYHAMHTLLEGGVADIAPLREALGRRPPRERLAGALDVARIVLGAALPGATPSQQARIIGAHDAISRLAREVPTYNYEPDLVVEALGAALAHAGPGVAAAGPTA